MAVLDLQVLFQLVGEDDHAFILETLDDFSAVLDETLLSIRHAYEEANIPKIGQFSHRLKGSSGAMGAEALAMVCLELDVAVKSENTLKISSLITQLESEIEIVKEFCRNYQEEICLNENSN